MCQGFSAHVYRCGLNQGGCGGDATQRFIGTRNEVTHCACNAEPQVTALVSFCTHSRPPYHRLDRLSQLCGSWDGVVVASVYAPLVSGKVISTFTGGSETLQTLDDLTRHLQQFHRDHAQVVADLRVVLCRASPRADWWHMHPHCATHNAAGPPCGRLKPRR